jgi:YbgC/YbaW family acyl-CoA thioester hydrolase
MASEFRTRRLLEFEDTDTAQIAHFSRFYVFMEQAEHAFLRSLGFSVHMEWEGTKLGWPRVAAACEFLKPIRFEEELEVHLKVRRKGTKSMTYAFDFRLDGELIARGEMTTVCCAIAADGSLAGVAIPPPLADQLEEHPE